MNDKYDSLRDKLLLDSLMNQFGKTEWDRLSEQERQSQLAKMRMLEKKLRREGKYDELSKLLGDAANNSDALGVSNCQCDHYLQWKKFTKIFKNVC